MKLFRVLVQTKLARSRSEAERLIKQGAVSVGGCSPDCGFFDTGKCTCEGWSKIKNVTEEIEAGLKVKVGDGYWRILTKVDGTAGFDQVNGIATVPAGATDPDRQTSGTSSSSSQT